MLSLQAKNFWEEKHDTSYNRPVHMHRRIDRRHCDPGDRRIGTTTRHGRRSKGHANKGRCCTEVLDRDLYVFCANIGDGKLVAVGNPNVKQLLGTDTRTIKDSNGKPFGQAMFEAYQKPEDQMTEVSYVWPRPGSDKTPVPKVSFVTKVGDLGCGVGYYK
jgi:Cache domain